MKFKSACFIALFGFSLLTGVIQAEDDRMSYSDMASALGEIGKECDPQPTEDIIRNILLNREEVDHDTKCFRRCIMELFDMHVPESTQMREESVLEFGGMMYPDRKEDFKIIFDTCNGRNSGIEDKCEAAHEHAICMLQELKGNGFDIPEIVEE